MPRLPDGVELPDAILVREGEGRVEAVGELVALDRDTAKREIDLGWWRAPGVPPRARRTEADRGWEWHTLVGRLRAEVGHAGYGWAVRAGGRIQGAILYQLPAVSELDPAAATLFVYRLATAPWNRAWVKRPRTYAGVGAGLLRLAVVHSHRFGAGGRVTLEAAAAPGLVEWYTALGFRLVSRGADGITVLELTPEAAAPHLAAV